MNLVAGVNASIAAASRQGFAAAAPRVWQAVAALPPSEQDVLRQLLEGMTAAICRDEAPAAQLWQEACLCYLDACSEAQLVGWSWRVDNGSLSSNFKKEAEVEVSLGWLGESGGECGGGRGGAGKARRPKPAARQVHDPLRCL